VDVSEDRSAALVVRVWLEDGPESLRARLTAVGTSRDGAPAEDVVVAVAASRSELMTAVSDWLERFLIDSAEPIDR
jgi:hypothetical protein